jgi:sulfur carrier protein ThiS
MSKRFSPDMKQPNNTMARVRTEVNAKKEQYGTISAIVRDKNGNIVQRSDQPVDSLIRAYWIGLYTLHNQVLSVSIPRTNSTTDGQTSTYNARLGSPDGPLEGYQGIVVGTSSNVVTYNDGRLGTLILHGVATGQLSAEETSVFYNVETDEVEIVRTFVNADTGASTITVREIGISVGQDSTQSFTIVRDVLDTALDIPYEGVLTVIYTLGTVNGTTNMTRLINRSWWRQRTGVEGGSTYVNVIATNGTGLTFTADGVYGLTGQIGMTSNGIVLGTSNTNPTEKNTFAMGSAIAHGNAAGQLFYYESTITSFEENVTTNSCKWYLNRVVQNRSGGAITVNEVGLQANVKTSTGATYATFLTDRKFPDEGGVTIADGQFATFSWEYCYIL